MKTLLLILVVCVINVVVACPVIAGGPAAKSKRTISPQSGNAQGLSDFEVGQYQYCGSDSDCVVVINGCCNCSTGGQEVTINKENVQRFKDKFKCNHARCGAKSDSDLCGSGVVSCVNHKCKYVSDVEFEALGAELKRK